MPIVNREVSYVFSEKMAGILTFCCVRWSRNAAGMARKDVIERLLVYQSSEKPQHKKRAHPSG
jgi:hypothetical protein